MGVSRWFGALSEVVLAFVVLAVVVFGLSARPPRQHTYRKHRTAVRIHAPAAEVHEPLPVHERAPAPPTPPRVTVRRASKLPPDAGPAPAPPDRAPTPTVGVVTECNEVRSLIDHVYQFRLAQDPPKALLSHMSRAIEVILSCQDRDGAKMLLEGLHHEGFLDIEATCTEHAEFLALYSLLVALAEVPRRDPSRLGLRPCTP
jgi:hypothetical protein